MKEEHSNVGAGSSVGVSKLPLSGEFLVGCMGVENQVGESYEEGDEGEVMVEVVGSDVFVNGVSGHSRDFECHEWENREETGSKNFLETMDVRNAADENKMGESEVKSSELNADGVSGDEVQKPGIGGMVAFSSAVVEFATEEVMERAAMVTGEGKMVECESVNKDSANFIATELLNRPVKAIVEGKYRTSEKEDIVSSSGNDADPDRLGEDSISYEASSASDGPQAGPSELPLNPNTEYQDIVEIGGIDGAVVEVDLVNAAVATEGPKNGVSRAIPGSQSDGCVIAEISKSKDVNIEIQADTEENQPNTTTSSSLVCTGIVLMDSGMHVDEPHIATSMVEERESGGNCGRGIIVNSGMLDPLANRSSKRVSIHAAKFSISTSHTQASFKIGEYIHKVASQLTVPTSLVKGNNDEMVIDGSPNISEHTEKQSVIISAESFSVNEMLSQLQLFAWDPRERRNIQNNTHIFFSVFRSSIVLNRRCRKKNAEPTIGGSGEEFEFDGANDSCWTDRIVQNYSAVQLRQDRENRSGNLQPVPSGAETCVKTCSKSHSRNIFSSGNYPMAATEAGDSIKRQKHECSPAELILNFADRKCLPSEINLNKMLRRFGPLMESETEVDHNSGRAKVIFKRGSDAEVARSSAEKFKMFGPVLVSYQIGYSPLISVKVSPLAVPQ